MIVSAIPGIAATEGKCACVPGKATSQSYTWDFKSEANAIFKDLQMDAQQSVNDAGMLQGDARAGLTWESQAGQLDNLKTDIDSLGVKLCRLETIRGAVAPWQQRVIDRIAASTLLMAGNATDAIQFGDARQGTLWMSTYQDYVKNLYDEAHRLKQSVGAAVEFASVSKKYREEVKTL
jgi:hypothetical protein